VPDVLILIVCMVLLTLTLGLPLLLKPDSLLPDIVAFAILAVAILAFIWSTGAYWITFPILSLMALVIWLDREGQHKPTTLSDDAENPRHDTVVYGAAGTNGRTQLRLRLWRAANRVQMALVASVVILLAAGFTRSLELIVPWMVIVTVAMVAFRFSFLRSRRRDQSNLVGEAGGTEYTQ
jgi:hypothetical protein